MQNKYYSLFNFFESWQVRWARVAIFFCVGFAVYLNRDNFSFVIDILPLYAFLLLQELFIHKKLGKMLPTKDISSVGKDITECMYFKTRRIFSKSKNIEEIIHEITQNNNVKFLQNLLGLNLKSEKVDFSKGDVLNETLKTVQKVRGKYIHSVDAYASILVLLEDKNKVLFNNDLTKEDVLTALSWVRKRNEVDTRKKQKFAFTGSGVFDFFVYGWSQEISRYASNFTEEVLAQENPIPIGRDSEYELLVTALSKSTSSNALIIGDAGSGKTTIVKQFALDSNEGNLPKSVSKKQVFKLYAERLIAGVKNEGDLEERFVYLFEELMHAGNVVVYIPNIENIFGGGGEGIDISGSIVEYLTSNRIKIIGSTTNSAFQTFIYPKQELKELFNVVEVKDADRDTTLFMLLEKADELTAKSGCFFDFNALKEVIKLSDSYINDGTSMPGRGVRLMEDVIAFCQTHGKNYITQNEVKEFVETKTDIILSKPTKHESQTLLNLENTLHKRVVSQNEAIKAISDAMRRVRSGMKDEGKPIASFLFLGPTGVGKTETAKALAESYFGDEKDMIRLDMSEYQRQDSVDRFLGTTSSEEYEETVADKILEKPFTLVLLDEFEKAHPQVLDLFLQIFDEGMLTDNRGRKISFKNTIIIATSNAGSEFIREQFNQKSLPNDFKSQLVDKILKDHLFKPELINRFDEVVIFNPLTDSDVVEVSKLFLNEVVDKISKQQISISYSNEVPEFIAKNAYSVEFGARNIRRFIEQSVENQLSKLILSSTLKKGVNGVISIENNALVIKT